MPKINVYLPDELAAAVKDAKLPVSAICQFALQQAVQDVSEARRSMRTSPGELPKGALLSRFTPRARQALSAATEEARAVPHDFVGTEHVLLGIIDDPDNLGTKVLSALNVEPGDLRDELVASMSPATREAEGHVPFTRPAKSVLEAATKEALQFGHNYIGCEHLLLGLVAVEDGLAGEVLHRMGVELKGARRAVATILAGVVHARTEHLPPLEPTSSQLDEVLRRLAAIEARLDD